ncbi:uncharacterized protein FTJAE_1158 [Fusarium tjaetaba]|uniref:Uncharacterized protein n=1 Tax=Fusarium tjaetaba TaxID=1567544 RepID=A0A8H5SEB2_9HYPO|nr:uncharacterized protein FTJAE_1158 [Fusarium tjaetaba]KAF5649162.1 hypothetical protein FTJAE_1158 [Fusarium tjaetaba]
MAITEVIFPKLKPDQALLKQLATTFPTAAKTTFSGVPGLSGYYRGKVIEAQNVSQAAKFDHSGLVLVLDSGSTTTSNYTQYIKVENLGSEDKSVENSWRNLTREIGLHAKSFHAWGVQESDGAFMGMIGWSSLETLKSKNEKESVKKALHQLTKHGDVTAFVLELSKQS